MKYFTYFLTLLVSSVLFSQAPTGYDWVHQIGKPTYSEFTDFEPKGFITTETGISYFVGQGRSPMYHYTDEVSSELFEGVGNSYVGAVDAFGDLIFGYNFCGACEINDFKIDMNNNIVIVGSFKYTCEINPDLNQVDYVYSGAEGDGFILKLDSEGQFMWAKQTEGNNKSSIGKVVIDDENNIYLFTEFYDSVDIDFGPNELYVYEPFFLSNHVLSKLDSSGNFEWFYYNDSFVFEDAYAEVSANNEVSVYGRDYTTNSVKIIQLDNNGSEVWEYKTPWVLDYIALSDGSYIAFGLFGGATQFDPSDSLFIIESSVLKFFLLKIDSNGNFSDVKTFGTFNSITCSIFLSESKYLVSSNDDKILLSMAITGDCDLNPDTIQQEILSSSRANYVLMQFNENMEYEWHLVYQEITAAALTPYSKHYFGVDSVGEIYGCAFLLNRDGIFVDVFSGDTLDFLDNNEDRVFLLKFGAGSTTSVNEVTSSYQCSIFPNPSSEIIKVLFNQVVNELQIQQVDLLGRVVNSESLTNVKETDFSIIGDDDFTFIKIIIDEKESKVFKVIREK